MNKFFSILLLLAGSSAVPLYDHAKSDVAIYSKLNFEKQVSKNRDKGISIVHYYSSEEASRDMKSSYEQFATENKGIFRIGSVNCDDHGDICKKEGVSSYPTVRIYPTFPIPTQDIDLSKGFEINKLKKAAGRFVGDASIEITGKNHQTFVSEDVMTPKVLLFTNAKKGTPFVYKALSSNFQVSGSIETIRSNQLLDCFSAENSSVRYH